MINWLFLILFVIVGCENKTNYVYDELTEDEQDAVNTYRETKCLADILSSNNDFNATSTASLDDSNHIDRTIAYKQVITRKDNAETPSTRTITRIIYYLGKVLNVGEAVNYYFFYIKETTAGDAAVERLLKLTAATNTLQIQALRANYCTPIAAYSVSTYADGADSLVMNVSYPPTVSGYPRTTSTINFYYDYPAFFGDYRYTKKTFYLYENDKKVKYTETAVLSKLTNVDPDDLPTEAEMNAIAQKCTFDNNSFPFINYSDASEMDCTHTDTATDFPTADLD